MPTWDVIVERRIEAETVEEAFVKFQTQDGDLLNASASLVGLPE